MTIAISATAMPAMQSSQKWLPVAMTANQTHAGQTAQKAFAHRLRQTPNRMIPTISASAACLEVEDRVAVVERPRGVPPGQAARELVEHGEAEPDGNLEPEIRPTARQMPAPCCDNARHIYSILDVGLDVAILRGEEICSG